MARASWQPQAGDTAGRMAMKSVGPATLTPIRTISELHSTMSNNMIDRDNFSRQHRDVAIPSSLLSIAEKMINAWQPSYRAHEFA